MLGCILEKVSDDGNLGSLWQWSAWGIRVDRSRRARINGRLGEHVVVERDRLVIAAFCVARSPFFRDRVPIGRRFGTRKRRAQPGIGPAWFGNRQSRRAVYLERAQPMEQIEDKPPEGRSHLNGRDGCSCPACFRPFSSIRPLHKITRRKCGASDERSRIGGNFIGQSHRCGRYTQPAHPP